MSGIEHSGPALGTASWQALVGHLDSAIFVLDVEDRIEYLSRAFLGSAPAKVVGASIHAMAGDSLDALRTMLTRMRATGQAQSFETTVVPPGASPEEARWIAGEVVPITLDARGCGALLLLSDVTERRRVAGDLRESEERWHSLIANSDDTIIVIDAEQVIRYINRVMAPHQPEDILVTSIYHYVMPEHHDIMRATIAKVYATGDSATYDTKLEPAAFGGDLPTMWFTTKVVPLKRRAGFSGAILIATDITARKRVELQLLASEERWRSLVDNTDDTIEIIDREGIIRFINRVIPPKTHGDIVGTSIFQYVAPGDVDRIRSTLEQVMTTGKAGRWETKLDMSAISPALPILYFSVKAVPTITEGVVSGAILIASDVSNQTYYEQQLRQAKEAAEAANRAKSTFLANISHEIRTPMNAILGFSHILLRDDGLTAGQRQILDVINRSGEHLLALLNDILELSKIEAGRVDLASTTFDLHALLHDLDSVFRPRADAKGLAFVCEMNATAPRYLVADPNKLRQALMNLLSNAIKFTDHGHIALRVRAERGQGPSLRLITEVEDTGVGMSPRDLELLFNAFQQTASGINVGGTGLGLALSRDFARLMGGGLTVSSQLGRGSTFRLEIQAQVGASDQVATTQERRRVIGIQPGQATIRVLVVDDKEEERLLLREMLRPIGFEVQEADNGAQALAQYEVWSPSVILMDIRLPEMDGYEATRRIKMTSRGQQTPIVAVSALTFREERQAALDAGANYYLRKPFKEHEVFEAIEACLGIRYDYAALEPESTPAAAPMAVGPPEAPAAPSEPHFVGRVLLVEDDPASRTVATLTLENLGCAVDAVANGEEAIERFRLGDYALVLTDCQMPVVDGYETARRIRGFEGRKGVVPIVALTAHTMPEDWDRCRAAGMDDHLSKPIREADVMRVLTRYLPLGDADALPIFDPDVMYRAVGDDPAAIAEVVGIYRATLPANLKELQAPLEAGDLSRVKTAAHKLKGGAANLGAPRLRQLALSIEGLATRGDLEGCRGAARRLEGELAQVLEVLDRQTGATR